MTQSAEISPRLDLIVCPTCDAAYALDLPVVGQNAVCDRCNTVLISPGRQAGLRIIALSLSIVILIVSAAVFPFLTVETVGSKNTVSILETALAFSSGPLLFLSFATICLIFLIPLLRVLLSLYVLVPLVADRQPARYAAKAFRFAEALRPWSMAEIFAIGCAVALVKVSALVNVSFGPAFWMFAVLAVLVVVQDSLICRWSVWNALSRTRTS